jgi:signal transduction histidine kinase
MTDTYLLILAGMAFTFMLALTLVIFYKHYRQKLMKQRIALQEAELAHRSALLYATIQSQEDERRRVGRDLHDGVGSMLSHLKLNINRLNAAAGPESALQEISRQCALLIDRTMNDVRSISHSLSPPGLELFGLGWVLEEMCEDASKTGVLNATLDNAAEDRIEKLDANASLMLYRVVQELLANTLKHASAENVLVRLSVQHNRLVVEYKDDGKGFDASAVPAAGMGLRNIESRIRMIGAAYESFSEPGKGFAATIRVDI